MITIEKTYGVKGVANDITMIRLQELIALAKNQYGWVGKAIIDSEKIMYYKFGLKLGLSRMSTNGLVVNEFGTIKYEGFVNPVIYDKQILMDLYKLFNKKYPF